MRRDIAGHIVTGLMVVCALTVTGLVARRELLGTSRPEARILWSSVKNAEQYHAKGNSLLASDGPVLLTIFSDYQCPACRVFDASLAEVVAAAPRTVSIRYRHFPLPNHEHAREAAFAAECAGRQGKFAEAHRELFGRQDSLGVRSWSRFGRFVGVADTAAFVQCVRDSLPAQIVQSDEKTARELGATGTPTILLNDRLYGGIIPKDSLIPLLQELAGTRRR